jgi:hypothetical protein
MQRYRDQPDPSTPELSNYYDSVPVRLFLSHLLAFQPSPFFNFPLGLQQQHRPLLLTTAPFLLRSLPTAYPAQTTQIQIFP